MKKVHYGAAMKMIFTMQSRKYFVTFFATFIFLMVNRTLVAGPFDLYILEANSGTNSFGTFQSHAGVS